MKGPKEGRGYRSSTQISGGTGGGGGSVTEAGALFPRLHVKETKRVGPRAPPRNKMALYEQFTFPSHRYVPPSIPLPSSKTPTAYTPQRPSYDCSMFYGPPQTFGGMPWMPYSEMYSGSYFGGQPSVNGSSSSTIVNSEGDLGQGTGVPSVDTGRPSSNSASYRSPWVSSHSNVQSISSKKARNNNDRTVPTYTPPVTTSHGHPTPSLGSDQLEARVGHHHRVDTASTRQPGSDSSDRHEEASTLATSRSSGGIRTSSGGPRGVKKADQSGKGGNKDHGEDDQSELQESTIFEKEKDSVALRSSHLEHSGFHYNVGQYSNSQCQQRKSSQADVGSDLEGLKSFNSSGECLTGIEDDRGQPSDVSHKARSTPKGSHGRAPALINSIARDTAQKDKARSSTGAQTRESALINTMGRDTTRKDRRGQGACEQGSDRQMHESDSKSISSAGSGDDLEITSGAEVVSESDEGLSDRAESDAGDASAADTELGCIMSKVAPRDIVNAVGEQEFWRARKLILRQQKIFSTQLFELHRIVKVQQLLASSPVMNEEMLTSTLEKPVETSEPAQAKHAQDAQNGCTNTDVFVENQGSEEDAAGKEPDSSGHSSTADRMCDQPPVVNSQAGQGEAGQVPAMLNATPGASAASWGGPPYAKTGVNNWFGAVPTPNGAYMYQPYPGSFHSPQVNNVAGYNGAYPVMCTPSAMDLATMNPYGVPRYEQQPNLMQDMYRYNSYQQQQWPAAVFCHSVPPNPGPSWCGVPPPVPFMNPAMRGAYGWYNDMAAGSHPSGPSNYVRPAPQNNAQPMPASFHPSSFVMHSPWADSSNSQQAGGEAERFRQQGQWPLSSETGQRTTPVLQKPRTYCSDQDCVQLGSQKVQGGGPFGACETSALSSQGPERDCTNEDGEFSLSQHPENGGNNGWRRYDGNYPRDSFGDPAEGSATDQHPRADKSDNLLKRGRGNRQVDGSGDKNGGRHSFESRKPPDGEMDALPLFPLGPAVNGVEERRPVNHSSSGVIKAVPRAMVATAESTAEILLSIQNQRQR